MVELDNSTIQGHLIGFSKLLSGLNFNSDLLLELCHVDFECINFFIPLGKLFVSLGFFIADGFLVDPLLEPLVRDSSPAAKQQAHLATIHIVLRVRLDALLKLFHVHKVNELVKVDSLDKEIILLTKKGIDFVL